jgi:hypothetical protein
MAMKAIRTNADSQGRDRAKVQAQAQEDKRECVRK